MKKWESEGLILSQRKHAEEGIVLSIFTPDQGVWRGWSRLPSKRSSSKIALQAGQIVHCVWSARIEEQLGRFQCEVIKDFSAHIFGEPQKLKTLSCMLYFLDSCLPERYAYELLYQATTHFMEELSGERYLEYYFIWEYYFLASQGFGLDLHKCAATGQTEDLGYISPKTGRAVCCEAAEPYKDKLFDYPELYKSWFKDQQVISCPQEELESLSKTMLYFLQKFLWEHQSKAFPQIRHELI